MMNLTGTLSGLTGAIKIADTDAESQPPLYFIQRKVVAKLFH